MEICSLTVVAGKDGKEYILKASDSTFALIGDSQEEDRRTIADIVCGRMQVSRRIEVNLHLAKSPFKQRTLMQHFLLFITHSFRTSVDLSCRNLSRDHLSAPAVQVPPKSIHHRSQRAIAAAAFQAASRNQQVHRRPFPIVQHPASARLHVTAA